MTTIRKILNRAADLVEQGWCQGSYFDGNDGYCLVGALAKAKETLDSKCKTYEVVSGYLERNRGFDPMAPLSLWNDAPGRTQSEVVALLREVAAEQG